MFIISTKRSKICLEKGSTIIHFLITTKIQNTFCKILFWFMTLFPKFFYFEKYWGFLIFDEVPTRLDLLLENTLKD